MPTDLQANEKILEGILNDCLQVLKAWGHPALKTLLYRATGHSILYEDNGRCRFSPEVIKWILTQTKTRLKEYA